MADPVGRYPLMGQQHGSVCAVNIDSVVIGLLYITYPNGCRHRLFIPARATTLPLEGASALVCVVIHLLPAAL